MAANGNGRAITKQQREEFLKHVREGLTRPAAAKAVDESLTGSKFRTLCLRDEAFAALYEEARRDGAGNFRDRVRTEYHRRAIEEPAKVSNRLLHNLAL